MSDRLSCLGALALELSPGSAPEHAFLGQAAAGELAERIARDLARFVPTAAGLDLAIVAALFDPVELLRPGWPRHAELERLIAQAPARGDARVIAFGARDGILPASLAPEADYAGGPLRLLPFVLRGDDATMAQVGAALEETLLETGMAAADTALLAQDHFGAAIEHARYLTAHDLAAMTAMQYEHAGLAALWPLIETALLAPEERCALDAPPEPLLLWRDGAVRIARFDVDTWKARGYAPHDADAAREARAYERFLMRQKQIAALLQGHALNVVFVDCPVDTDPRQRLDRG
ncbi:hypothetical protein [Arenimonas sp.]|uniref:hypothetical protein n=1 Tax=Arenimonas sp. TaxID=1872635 RepID=UPI0039E42E75